MNFTCGVFSSKTVVFCNRDVCSHFLEQTHRPIDAKNLSFLVTFSALSSGYLVSYSSNFILFTFLLVIFYILLYCNVFFIVMSFVIQPIAVSY